jgi:hypothetical protein
MASQLNLPSYNSPNLRQPFSNNGVPVEIIKHIAYHCDTTSLARFLQCNRRLRTILHEYLWMTGIERPGKPALYWAIETGNLWLATTALVYYHEMGAKAAGMLDGTAVLFDTFDWIPNGMYNFRCDPASRMPQSPIMRAVKAGWNKQRLKVLIDAGCDINVRRRTNWADFPSRGGELHYMCDRDACQELTEPWMESLEDDPDLTHPCCVTALHDAIMTNRPDLLDFLLANGADRGRTGQPDWEDDGFDSILPLPEYCTTLWWPDGVHRLDRLGQAQMQILYVLHHYGYNIRHWIPEL